MPLSDFIGAISAIAGLYDFIDGKLKNDYRAFVSQIEKNIRVACKNFSSDLHNSVELLPYAEKIREENKTISSAVISALKMKKPFTYDNFLPDLEMPEHIRKAAFEAILDKLLTSLRYAQLHYSVWINMTQEKTLGLLRDMDKKIDAIEVALARTAGNANTNTIHDKQAFLYKQGIYGNEKYTLESLFVPYPVTYQYKDQRIEFGDCFAFFDQYEYFGEERLLLMLGDYGVGKSSTFKMLLKQDAAYSYVFIPLIDILTFSDNIKGGIEEYCERKYKFKFSIEKVAQEERCVILLDGFDELQKLISQEDEMRYFRQILALTDYVNISIVLSSRGTAFINKINVSRYPQIYLDDFTEKLIGDWVSNWVAINKSYGLETKISFEALKERELIEVVSNKLILYMTALIFEEELMEVRQYSKAQIFKLFIDWTITGKFVKDASAPYIPEEKKRLYRKILQEIAYVITIKRRELITYSDLHENLVQFQNEEVDALLFDIQVQLFTQQFFTLSQNQDSEKYISFSHKSFRQYLTAEKIYTFYSDYINTGTAQYSIWYQLGLYTQFEIECFDFVKDMISGTFSSEDILAIYKFSLSRTALFMDSEQFTELLISNQSKKSLQPANAYTRSLVLATLSAIINHITANILIENIPKSIRPIAIDNIFKLCNFYIKGANKFFLRNYYVFLKFVRHINLYEEDIQKVQYQMMCNINLYIMSSSIQYGSVFAFESSKTEIFESQLKCISFSNCVFRCGVISNTSFRYCSFSKVAFESVAFENVVFKLSDEMDITFANCSFSDCYFENIVFQKSLFNKAFEAMNYVNSTAQKLMTQELVNDPDTVIDIDYTLIDLDFSSK